MKDEPNIIAEFETEDGFSVEVELVDIGGGESHIHVNYFGGTVTLLTSFTKDEAIAMSAGLAKAVDAMD